MVFVLSHLIMAIYASETELRQFFLLIQTPRKRWEQEGYLQNTFNMQNQCFHPFFKETYSFIGHTEYSREESSLCWFTFQMAARAKPGPG